MTNAKETLGVVETLMADGFELDALSYLGIFLVVDGPAYRLEWTSVVGGRCAAPVESVEDARWWAWANYKLFLPVAARKGA